MNKKIGVNDKDLNDIEKKMNILKVIGKLSTLDILIESSCGSLVKLFLYLKYFIRDQIYTKSESGLFF